MAVTSLHEAVLNGLPSGLIVIDLKGKITLINQSAQRILGLKNGDWHEKPCREVFDKHLPVAEILLEAASTLKALNRQELRLFGFKGSPLVLGYGTLVFRNGQGEPMGVGMICQDITRFVPIPLTSQFVSLINKFFTPFTAIMVSTALIWGLAEKWEKGVAAVIMIAMGLFNWAMSYWAGRSSERFTTLVRIHTPLNFLAFTALVYFMGTLWGPMWLLLALVPLATGLYAGRGVTILVAVIAAAVLLAIYDSRGLTGSIGWAQAFLHATFIIFISLFVQALTTLVSRSRTS